MSGYETFDFDLVAAAAEINRKADEVRLSIQSFGADWPDEWPAAPGFILDVDHPPESVTGLYPLFRREYVRPAVVVDTGSHKRTPRTAATIEPLWYPRA